MLSRSPKKQRKFHQEGKDYCKFVCGYRICENMTSIVFVKLVEKSCWQLFTFLNFACWKQQQIFNIQNSTKSITFKRQVLRNILIFISNFPYSQSYIYQVLQTIQMKLILLCVWAEPAFLGSTKTALKFIYKI